MANDANTQQALANDNQFRRRVRNALSAIAWQMLGEDALTPNHKNREAYARQVTRQLDTEVNVIAPSFVMRPNVNNFETTYVYDFVDQIGHVATAATDADLASQLASDWDTMAAAAGFAA